MSQLHNTSLTCTTKPLIGRLLTAGYISVIPENDQSLAISSPFNATFSCNVSEDELNSAQREAIWEVQSVQIPSGESLTRSAFEVVGIFIEEKSVGVSDLIVTSAASELYGDTGVMVRCIAFTPTTPPTIEVGLTLFVRFYGKYLWCEV